MVFNALFLVALCNEVVNGLVHEAPKATKHTAEHYSGWTPIPTGAPMNPHELLRRQTSLGLTESLGITDIFASTILQGADETCGYLSGSAGAKYTCGGQATCNFWPGAQAATRGVVACCLAGTCYPRADCINSRDYKINSICNDACDADTYTLKCTAASAPYCNTAVWGDVNVRDVYCASRSVSTTQTFYTTYDGQVIGGKFSPLVLDDLTSTASSSTRSSSTVSTTPSVLSSTSSRPASTSLPGGTGLPSFTIIPNPDPPKAATPIGAIVGGAVGGVALLALIGLAIFAIRRRSRRNTAAAGSAAPVVHTDSHNQAPPPVYHHQDNPNNTYATPLPPHTSEMDGAGSGKPPPMSSVSEHGYFAPAPIPKPYGGESQYQQPSGSELSGGGDTRRTSAVSPVSPPPQFSTGAMAPPPAGSPHQSGRDSYVSSGYETYPSYPPPGAHEMPGNEVRR